jgi:hypothetical protein
MALRRRNWQEAGGRLHNEELHNLYASPNIIRIIKTRRVRRTGRTEGMGDMRNAYKILVGSLRREQTAWKT